MSGSIVETLAVVAVSVMLASLAVPLSATAIDNGRVRMAAAFVGSRFRLAKVEAVNKGANVGIVFDQTNGRWSLRVCRDGTGDGLQRADIAAGSDPCFDGPHDFTAMFPGVDIAVSASLVGPAGEPGNPDPVRFGTSDIASFSALGGCTAGSLYLRSLRGQVYAVRVAGTNGRLRILRYEAGPGRWV